MLNSITTFNKRLAWCFCKDEYSPKNLLSGALENFGWDGYCLEVIYFLSFFSFFFGFCCRFLFPFLGFSFLFLLLVWHYRKLWVLKNIRGIWLDLGRGDTGGEKRRKKEGGE